MIRRLRESDLPGMMEWMHDTSINCNFRFDFSAMTEEKALDFIRNSFSSENQNFAIVNEEDEYMGTISLKNISDCDRSAEYAIVTRSCAHGKGYAYAATREILRYGFAELGLRRIYLNVLEKNRRANAFYQKCGFQQIYNSEKNIFVGEKKMKLNWYEMTSTKYYENRGGV